MAHTILHLEEKYNTLVANTNDGFYLFNTENELHNCSLDKECQENINTLSKKFGPYCEIYKPSLIRMLSPLHCIFVTEKSSDSTTLPININDIINAFTKSHTIMIFSIEQNKILVHFTIGNKILNMIIVDKYILIVTINQVLVYSQNILTNNNDPNNIIFLKTIHTFNNPNGLCNAKCFKNSLIIATLGRTTGEIIICKTCDSTKHPIEKKTSNLYIQAHNYNITNITLDDKCELIATTSESGTLINIFDISSCNKLYQFRRGIFGTIIHDISFDPTSNYIACCSNNGTCHVFHLYDKSNDNEHKNTTSSFSALGPIVSVCQSEWAYKLFKIKQGVKSQCSFVKINNKINIHIVSDDLMYYVIEDVEKDIDQIIKYDISKLINKNEIK